MFILETWMHILRDILLNNVTKKYAELSVGDYGMLIQRCNNDVCFIYNGIKTRNNWTRTISLIN